MFKALAEKLARAVITFLRPYIREVIDEELNYVKKRSDQLVDSYIDRIEELLHKKASVATEALAFLRRRT